MSKEVLSEDGQKDGIEMLTNEQIRDLLRKETLKWGGQRKWARKNKVLNSHVNRIINGERDMMPSVAKALGYERMWVKINPK